MFWHSWKLASCQWIHEAGLTNTVSTNETIFSTIAQLEVCVLEQCPSSDNNANLVEDQIVILSTLSASRMSDNDGWQLLSLIFHLFNMLHIVLASLTIILSLFLLLFPLSQLIIAIACHFPLCSRYFPCLEVHNGLQHDIAIQFLGIQMKFILSLDQPVSHQPFVQFLTCLQAILPIVPEDYEEILDQLIELLGRTWWLFDNHTSNVFVEVVGTRFKLQNWRKDFGDGSLVLILFHHKLSIFLELNLGVVGDVSPLDCLLYGIQCRYVLYCWRNLEWLAMTHFSDNVSQILPWSRFRQLVDQNTRFEWRNWSYLLPDEIDNLFFNVFLVFLDSSLESDKCNRDFSFEVIPDSNYYSLSDVFITHDALFHLACW